MRRIQSNMTGGSNSLFCWERWAFSEGKALGWYVVSMSPFTLSSHAVVDDFGDLVAIPWNSQ